MLILNRNAKLAMLTAFFFQYTAAFIPSRVVTFTSLKRTSSNTSPAILRSATPKAEIESLNDTSASLRLGLSQLRPFLGIAVPFFKEDKTARNSLAGVVGLTLLNSGVSVAFSYISRDFYNALNARDEQLFYEKIELFFAALLVAVPITVLYRFLREKLSIYWREALTERVLSQYYSSRAFYRLEVMREIDNPDQRISEDVRHFTKSSLDFFITLLTSAVDLLSFSAVLFQIYPPLFLAIIAYAGVGSIVTTKLGQNLVSLNYERLRREADFRFSLIRTRENAESIAFYDTEAKREREVIWGLFKEALESQLGIVTVQRNLEVFTTSYRYLVQILPSLIVAPLYFRHEVELGTISQSYGAFNHILGDFSIIINQFESLSAFSAGLTRLTTFLVKLDNSSWVATSAATAPASTSASSNTVPVTADNTISSSARSARCRSTFDFEVVNPVSTVNAVDATDATAVMHPPHETGDRILDVRNLTLYTPDGKRLLIGGDASSAVNFALTPSDHVLIVGPSGAGKSSFVRALSGLWRTGSGRVTWHDFNMKGNENEVANALDIARKDAASYASGTDADSAATAARKPADTPPEGVFFLPQKPYNILGSLRDQIMYPSNSSHHRHGSADATGNNDMNGALEEELLALLDTVRLGSLASRMGSGDAKSGLYVTKDWSKVLSLGEQQRLAFARVLYNRPRVIFLDEATSALDLENERAMYEALQALDSVTYVSVGHRPSLLRYHSKKLVLAGPGNPPHVEEIPPLDDDNDSVSGIST